MTDTTQPSESAASTVVVPAGLLLIGRATYESFAGAWERVGPGLHVVAELEGRAVAHALIVDLSRNAIMTALLLAAPMLVVALGLGLVVSVLQAVTQIQEQTLAFVPKLVGVAVVFLVALPWMIQLAVKYTTELFRSLPAIAG